MFALVASVLVGAACTRSPESTTATPSLDTPEIAVVRAATAAFNAHDPEKLAALYAEDIKWLGIDSDKISVEGEGRTAVRDWLAGYFRNNPNVRSEISDLAQTGIYVSFRERTTWTAQDGSTRAQTALAVYQVRDGKIKRAWYFPAVRETAPSGKAD